MRQPGLLLLRFWVFLAIAIVAGVLVFGLVMSAGAWLGSGLPALAFTIAQFLWTIAALIIAITIGSAVWNLLYRVSGIAPFQERERLKPDHGQDEAAAKKPERTEDIAKNVGTLREFLKQNVDPEFRIGIVLAGGGAKGVYQAGALRALWEFLEEQGALEHVRMIVGTSIGAWNSMFWLTGQVKAGGWDQGPQYEWWTSSRLSTVVNPTFYIPVLRNYLAGNQVWRRQFTALFSSKPCKPPPYLYLTRTNIESASLEFTTTRKRGMLPNYRRLANDDHSQDAPLDIEQIEFAVFASMDIPPAFERLQDEKGHRYEDGGVIDNLPIQFATWWEGCNLLFVFPLNATFDEHPPNASIVARMARVLDVRQGVLERDSLKDISLYNRIIEGEQAKQKLAKESPVSPSVTTDTSNGKLTELHNKPSTTFCICPAPPMKVGTFGFWSLKRHGRECFKLMYDATKAELAKFDFSTGNQTVRMAKVGPDRKVTYEDFTLR